MVSAVSEVAQTLCRAMERLDNQSRQIEKLDTAIQALSEKVDRISRDFAYARGPGGCC